jgi:hypothetical protein
MARLRIASALAAALLLAACGGGGSLPGASSNGANKFSAKPLALIANPSNLTFTSLQSSASQSFTVTAQNPGTLTASSSDESVATVNPPSATTTNGQQKMATFTVTPVGNGTAKITVTDKKNATVTVSVTVAAPTGPLTASTSSVTICPSSGAYSCDSNAQSFSIAQLNFSGTFTESDNCDPHVAAVAAQSPNGPNATFTVTGQSQTGTCRATFTGANGSVSGVGIVVAAPGLTIDSRMYR